MLIKKFSSVALFLGILSSITCQGASGAGSTSGSKGDYIYIEKEKQGDRESSEKEKSLLNKVKNKLKQAKDFVYQNPVEVGAAGLVIASAPAIAYAGYKIKQNYFSKEDTELGKGAEANKDVQKSEIGTEVNKEVSRSETNEEIKNEVTNVPVNEENLPVDQDSGEETKSPVETEQGEPSNSNEETEKSKEPDSNIVDSAAKGTDLNPSANTNAEDENENTNENLKSVFLGVYSDLLVYLLLKLTPQSWGLQKGWYNLWHYKNGRLAHPFKLILGLLSWLNLAALIFGLGHKIVEDIKDVGYGSIMLNIGVSGAVFALSPNVVSRIIFSLMGESPKERVLGGILGPVFFLFTKDNENENNAQ